MNPRAALALALSAGLPAAVRAQEMYQVHYSWQEVLAGTVTPIGASANSILDPGEGARIRLGVTALINGTNAVGQTTSYTYPASGGVGTVRGIGFVAYDLIGDSNNSSAGGTWNDLQGPFSPFTHGLTPGTVQPGSASIHGMTGTQWVPVGETANGANNNQQLFRSVWNPTSYGPRTVNFLARPSVIAPAGQHNSVLLAYGLGTAINPGPGTGEPFNFDLLVAKYVGTDFGGGLNIPIVPAPASLALLGLGAVALRPPRRRHP